MLSFLFSLILLIMPVLGPAGDYPIRSDLPRLEAASRAIQWLHSQQTSDGSFGSVTLTADAVKDIALFGGAPDSQGWAKNGVSVYAALEARTKDYLSQNHEAGVIAKVVLAVDAAGGNVHDFAGYDLVSELQSCYDSGTGLYHPTSIFQDSLAILALSDVGQAVPDKAVRKLQMEERAGGCWGWGVGGTSCDTDTTALVVLALRSAGVNASDLSEVLKYLAEREHPDAGWGSWEAQTASNSDSTALALLALASLGENPRSPRWGRVVNGEWQSPLIRLLRFQDADGSFRYTDEYPESRLMAVLDVVPALAAEYPGDGLLEHEVFLPMLVLGEARALTK